MTRAVALVPTLLVLLTLAGCGPASEVSDVSSTENAAATGAGGAEPTGRISDLPTATETPSSAERGVTGRAFVADVPEGWTETRVDDVFDLRYLAGETELDPLLSISGDFGQFGGARAAVSTLIAQIQIGTPGFTIHSQQDVEIEGASSAVRVDFSFGTEEDEGVYDAMWVTAVDSANGDTVALAVSAAQGELDEGDFDRIADSLTMLPAGG